MKALLTAFALLSFVAASTLPMAASAADAQTEHTMDKPDTMSGDHMNSDKSMSDKKPDMAMKHGKSHKKAVHKKAKHHSHTAKKTKKHMSPPKAG